MHLFYRNGTLVTLTRTTGGCIWLFNHERQCLAVHHTAAPQVKLSAVDKMNTPALYMTAKVRLALVACVYGYIEVAHDLPSGFNGERLDPVSGFYGMGHGYRWYSPVLRRFLSTDSISPFGRGGINSYAYAGGDPVNRFDPDGHGPEQYLWLKNLSPINIRGGSNGFYSQSPNVAMQKKALFIVGHGAPGNIELNGQVYDALGLTTYAEGLGIDFKDYRLINILSCHSGTSIAKEGGSLAQGLANLTKLDVFGYDGATRTVFAHNSSTDLYAIGLLRAPYEGFADIQRQTPDVHFAFSSIRFSPPIDSGKAGSSIRQG
ncbi:RHS repeat-associated core domain-containing protein [Pseudomonas xanthosomatis]|uniref:RHS repeat-associated core domain-containing protein n=1 Tax=Pseudomonas xanthosomatis TaxID=2842356 RepID=UPI0035179716